MNFAANFLKKIGMSPIYMDAAAYTQYARDTFLGEREALKLMGVQVK